MVKTAIVAVLSALIITGVITISAESLAAWGVAVEVVLGLFYVRQATVSKDGLEQLGRDIAARRPLAAAKAAPVVPAAAKGVKKK